MTKYKIWLASGLDEEQVNQLHDGYMREGLEDCTKSTYINRRSQGQENLWDVMITAPEKCTGIESFEKIYWDVISDIPVETRSSHTIISKYVDKSDLGNESLMFLGFSDISILNGEQTLQEEDKTIMDTLKQFIHKNYKPNKWFLSADVKKWFDEKMHEDIKKSTLSTYLVRMKHEGILVSRGPRNNREYKIKPEGESP